MEPRPLVRPLRSVEEYRACQDLQRRAWGISDDGYVVPVATLVAAHKVGGLVIGAFAGQGQALVGFSFAFLGRIVGQLVLYSQLAAVDPASQSAGVGRALKQYQRDWAQAEGLAAVAWTFDPLQAVNARFNLAVLGATSRQYEVDLYGQRSDALNAGLATDRLLAWWPTAGERKGGCSVRWPDGIELINTDDTGIPRLTRASGHGTAAGWPPRLHVAIPLDSNALRQSSIKLAQAWQLAVRQAFQTAFAAGYVAVGFARAGEGHDLPCYLLERGAEPSVPTGRGG